MSKPVLIKWEDSGAIDGLVWQFKDDWECNIHECQSIGFLVSKDKRSVVLAQSENKDQYGRLFAIPTGCIISIKTLKEG